MILPLLSCVSKQLAVRTGTKNNYGHYLSLCANQVVFSVVGIYFPSIFPRNRRLGVLIFLTFPFFSIDTSRTCLSLTSKPFAFLSFSSSSIPKNPNFSLHYKSTTLVKTRGGFSSSKRRSSPPRGQHLAQKRSCMRSLLALPLSATATIAPPRGMGFNSLPPLLIFSLVFRLLKSLNLRSVGKELDDVPLVFG